MLAEDKKIVPIGIEENMNADLSLDSIDMSGAHKATIILMFGTLGTASSTLAVYSGDANADLDSAIYFKYAWGGAAQGTATAGSTTSCDVLAAWTEANSVTITHGTYSNYMLVIEVDAAKMDIANGEHWLTVRIPREGSATGSVTAVAILEPRYTGNRSETVLAE